VILADTSAWVEFDRASGSQVDGRITGLIAQGGPLAVTEPVMMEVLAAARGELQFERLNALLLRCELLAFEAPTDFEQATRIYRRCRAAGIMPRGILDCMIASVALRTGASLLSADADLHRIASVAGIAVEPT
jgi:predicted nucleic acid-binding protein